MNSQVSKSRCRYCGSGRHTDSHCNIYLKAELLKQGINKFDIIIDADTVEDAVDQITKLKKSS